jgi:DNA-binding transcriptional LysR family regulator
MNIDRILHFRKIYELKSLTQASLELALSKTAVSLSLKALEAELERQLFTRTQKQMLPTADGDQLYKHSHDLIQAYQTLKDQLEDKNYTGTFRIGAPVCFGSEFLFQNVRSFKKKYPDLNFDITLDDGLVVKQMLESGEIDLAIIGDDARKEITRNFHLEPIYAFELVMVCTPTYFAKQFRDEKINFDSIKMSHFINLKNVSTENWFNLHFNQPYKVKSFMNIANHHNQIKCLLASDGIGIQAKYSIQKYLDNGKLIELRPTQKKYKYKFYSVKHLSQIPKKIMKEFETQLKNNIMSVK